MAGKTSSKASEGYRELWAHGQGEGVEPGQVASCLSADSGLVMEYIQEARDHLVDAELHIATLKDDPQNKGAMEAILRAIHSMKSGASFLHLKDIYRCTHETESLLDFALKGDVKVTPMVHDLLFETVDTLRTLLTNVETALEGDGLLYSWSRVNVLVEALRQAFIQQVIGGEIEPNDGSGTTLKPVFTPPPQGDRSDVIRVSSTLCDLLQFKVAQLSRHLQARGKDEQIRELMQGIEESVHQLCYVTLGSFLPLLERATQEMAGVTGKKVDCVLLGGDWLIPRKVGETLKEVLTQLVRNGIAHGIETPEARKSRGKEEVGLLLLMAYRDGDQWCLEISDDGAGVCRDTILQQARHAGLLERRRDPTPEEIDDLIFAPGITTTPAACEVAGRGVGLDIVRHGVQRLGGTVEVHSLPGEFTCFCIRLPIDVVPAGAEDSAG